MYQLNGFLIVFLVLALDFSECDDYKKVNKRSLFRHQVIPSLGGKIPHSAFDSYRLNNNLLSRNGIYSNDGILLQQKYFKNTHGKNHRHRPSTVKLNIERNNDYAAEPGRYIEPETIETTYVIRDHVNEFPVPFSQKKNNNLHLISVHPLKFHEVKEYYSGDSEGLQIFQYYAPLLKAVLNSEQFYLQPSH